MSDYRDICLECTFRLGQICRAYGATVFLAAKECTISPSKKDTLQKNEVDVKNDKT